MKTLMKNIIHVKYNTTIDMWEVFKGDVFISHYMTHKGAIDMIKRLMMEVEML